MTGIPLFPFNLRYLELYYQWWGLQQVRLLFTCHCIVFLYADGSIRVHAHAGCRHVPATVG